MLALGAAPAAAETCHDAGVFQFGRIWLCASSVLAAQPPTTYGPEHLFDGDDATAWCEGAAGTGVGQWVEVRYDRPLLVQDIEIETGFARRPDLFRANGIPARVRIRAGDLEMTATLQDTPSMQPIRLPRLVETDRVRLVIESVRPGTRWSDTCINTLLVVMDPCNFRRDAACEARLAARPAAAWHAETSFNPRNGATVAWAEARSRTGALFRLSCGSNPETFENWMMTISPLAQRMPGRLCLDVGGSEMCGSLSDTDEGWRADNLREVAIERIAAGRILTIREPGGPPLARFDLTGSRDAIETARSACGL